jgi:hypothetical protein
MYTKSETYKWAEKNFKSVALFNKKKVKRLVQIGARLAEGKGTSLARLFDSWYDTKATYKLLNEAIMTPDTIQASHRDLVYQDIEKWEGDILAIEDSSEFEWNRKNHIEGLGPVGSKRTTDQGFVLHSTLAVGVSKKGNHLRILGLPYQKYHIRSAKLNKRRNRSHSKEALETDLWREAINSKSLPAQKKVIRVCDRAADIYEVLMETKEYGCAHIIRLKHDRQTIEPTEKPIKALMRELDSMGQTVIEKRVKGDTNKQKIILNVNWLKVTLRSPARPKSAIGKLASLEETVVRVWGTNPLTGEPIEWFLYTDIEIENIKDAIKITQYYALRWIIEDYHKMLKTGLRAENLQFETASAIFAAIAIMSVVATRLVELRERLKTNPEGPAEESGLDELELMLLRRYLKREIKTVKCVALAIGRLGGHQNRKSDGMPGLLTLWWGMSRLLTLVEGFKCATN